MSKELSFLLLTALLVLVVLIIIFSRQRRQKTTKTGVTGSLFLGITGTRQNFLSRISELLNMFPRIDDDVLEQLENTLIAADIGVKTSAWIIEVLRERIATRKMDSSREIQAELEDIIRNLLKQEYSDQDHFTVSDSRPYVILFAGVNGVGKTTCIGKLAYNLKNKGYSILLIAADTFRAAAAEQLKIWGERAGVPVHTQLPGADPAAVVYDGLSFAIARNVDVVMIDTAGRQHTRANLMNELNKICRTVKKLAPQGPQERLLVVDATTGQNALNQADLFHKAVNLTGIVLTKLDGTAKGGIVIGIKHQFNIPVKFIGVGEKQEDLLVFNPDAFVDAIFREG